MASENNVRQLQEELDLLRSKYDRLQRTRAMRINRWLERLPKLGSILRDTYDSAAYLFGKNRDSTSTEDVTIEHVVRNPSHKVVSVCHPHWQGVRSAAEGQSPNVLLLPEASPKVVERAVGLVLPYAPTHIILNGFWTGYDDFARKIRTSLGGVQMFYVHHGSFYQMLENRELPDILALIINLQKEGVITRIGFVKHGMAETLNALGIESCPLLNRIPLKRRRFIHSWTPPIRVFIPATDHLRKNLHTQVLAALMFEEADEVHVIGPVDMSYLGSSNVRLERLIVHRQLSRNRVLDLIDKSTIVLYVSISECAPMIPLECFSAGVPCLSGANHGLLKDDSFLEEMLVIKHEDDPNSIVEGIHKVKKHYKEISQRIIDFSQAYDLKARKSLEHFLGIEEK